LNSSSWGESLWR